MYTAKSHSDVGGCYPGSENDGLGIAPLKTHALTNGIARSSRSANVKVSCGENKPRYCLLGVRRRVSDGLCASQILTVLNWAIGSPKVGLWPTYMHWIHTETDAVKEKTKAEEGVIALQAQIVMGSHVCQQDGRKMDRKDSASTVQW